MAIINAYKMDGLGNDFVIIDRAVNEIILSKDKIIELGKRDNIGFDQIIFIEKKRDNIFPITIYNSDGGEVSACGNGSRCIAYLLSKKINSKNIQIKTNNRVLKAEILGNFSVKLKIGKPIFDWKKIPLSQELVNGKINLNIEGKLFNNGFCVNVGNPHIIFFVKDCYEENLKNIGPKIENHSMFPDKINVTFAQLVNKNLIKVNVWERGAGLTKACGTAACATAVTALRNNIAENKVDIKFIEGLLKIEIDKSENIFMTGPVSDIKKINIEI